MYNELGPAAYRNDLDGYLAQIVASIAEIKADFNLLRGHSLNQCLDVPIITADAGAATCSAGAAADYVIAGKTYTKAITANFALTACAEQADNTYCKYLLSIIADGTITCTKGTEVATDASVLPALPASSAPYGVLKVVTSGGTFTAGTTNTNGAGVTMTVETVGPMYAGASASTDIAATIAAATRGA